MMTFILVYLEILLFYAAVLVIAGWLLGASCYELRKEGILLFPFLEPVFVRLEKVINSAVQKFKRSERDEFYR